MPGKHAMPPHGRGAALEVDTLIQAQAFHPVSAVDHVSLSDDVSRTTRRMSWGAARDRVRRGHRHAHPRCRRVGRALVTAAFLIAATGVLIIATVLAVREYVREGTTARFAVWTFLGWSFVGLFVLGLVAALSALAKWVLS